MSKKFVPNPSGAPLSRAPLRPGGLPRLHGRAFLAEEQPAAGADAQGADPTGCGVSHLGRRSNVRKIFINWELVV